MTYTTLEAGLRRLVIGLADQDIKVGQGFSYDGGVLVADDVAEIGFASIVCLAQNVSTQLGMGGLGYRLEIGAANPVFPLHAVPEGDAPLFMAAAPFVTDVFMNDVRECRHDLALLFERAARVLDPAFALASHTTYATGPVLAHASVSDLQHPGLGR